MVACKIFSFLNSCELHFFFFRNQGWCQLSNVTSTGAPPNLQIPLCACQLGNIPPQCYQNTMEFFGMGDFVVYRWIYCAIAICICFLALLVIAQHIFYAIRFKFVFNNRTKLVGAFCVLASAIASAMYWGINPRGWVYGFPTASDVQKDSILAYFSLLFVAMGIAISTCN